MGDWSPATLTACYVCRFLWCSLVIGACGYAVFILDRSGWWFALALLICAGDCKAYRSPAQIREWAKLPEDDR